MAMLLPIEAIVQREKGCLCQWRLFLNKPTCAMERGYPPTTEYLFHGL